MKKIISLGVLFIGALSFTQERIDGQSAVQAQFGYIPSTGDFSDGKIIRLEYDRVMDNKGWLGKAGIFYKDYEVGYTHNQILPYKKIGINVVAGYTYEGLIRAGETVALIGESGSGKSTIAALLAGFYTPEAGAIYIDGYNLADVSLADRRRAIAFVSQDTVLFSTH